MEKLIKRINELANKSKTEGLNSQEKEEQAELREKYLAGFRANFKETLINVKLVDEDGTDITPQKVIDEKNRRKDN